MMKIANITLEKPQTGELLRLVGYAAAGFFAAGCCLEGRAPLAAGLLAAVPGLASGGEAYGTARLWAWTAALFAGTGLYLWQLKVMYGKIRRGETICWN